MGALSKLRKLCDGINEISYRAGQLHGEKKKIKDERRRKIYTEVSLTLEQEQRIDTFYAENYRGVEHHWHRLYQAFTGNFDEKYLPEYIFSSEIEPAWNSKQYREALSDKNLLFIYVSGLTGVRTPDVFLSRVSGFYRDALMNPISEQEAIMSVWDIGEVVIKPTVESGSGKNVRFLVVEAGVDKISGESIEGIIGTYSGDFNIQECVKNHPVLDKINPSSVNTFRVVTYIWEGRIYHMPVALRIGQGGARVDNAHAGGMFVGVSDTGELGKSAFTEFKDEFVKHPDTGTVFEGYIIPQVPVIIDVAYQMHARTPQLKVMSWDLTIDEQGNVVLIEVNTIGQTVWFPQMANGKSAFGNNTAEILKSIK